MFRLSHISALLAVLLHGASSLDPEVVVLRAARGRQARLPCGQGRVFLDGPAAYVLWLKNDRDLLYRFPNEDTEHKRGLTSGTVCDGDACHDETALELRRVAEQDAGVYRCRVHYQASPAVDYVIELRLVDSPGVPRIYNDLGEEIKKGYVGPYRLGDDMTIVCEVLDEQVDTLVYWQRNGEVIARAAAPRGGVRRAEVRVRGMTRAELDAHYECLAHNADVTAPLSASVVVKMYLPPLSVEIRMNSNPDFEAGQPRVVDCVVVGSVPPPTIAWTLGDAVLRPNVHKEMYDGNFTVSSLTLAPSLREGGRPLVCRATNTHLPDQPLHDTVALNVGFRPECVSPHAASVGVVVGEPETVTCVVDAVPAPFQLSWTFANGRTLYTSLQAVAGHEHRYTSSLTWQPAAAELGTLQCRAANAFGEQRRACAVTLARGGPPAAPDCVLLRAYPDQLRVHCKKGWDGGRPQTVHVVVEDASGGTVLNASDASGQFTLAAPPGPLRVRVRAATSRGLSPEHTLTLDASSPPPSPLPASAVTEKPSSSWTQWAEAGAGALALLGACVAAALCARALRAKRDAADNSPDLVPRPDGSFHREPDFAREERVVGTTNITVNQLASCPNQYSTSPTPCRVVVCPHSDSYTSGQHSYFL